ncbi:hypothetical protein RDG65_003178 [Vibrio fluvialis]|uniref:hypothetical protein n=1 Tax=Vibrio fluvialis TaxID=676 RepID=UPI001F3F8AE8|nr:hypothetical protein [Vibrio fluvialis]EKO3373817.1 hypothetical protein [Vibrio fluvialis]ELE5027868.1 hypothetical protein [Vibrio fluvialis]MCE7612107.1 hypothetical protein [Vibrio fluvialis]MCE7618266.1 hypothetical protein [Vibrio fluvialis]MCE7628709.1 hypothetical protein [Vibrio fluvialis]
MDNNFTHQIFKFRYYFLVSLISLITLFSINNNLKNNISKMDEDEIHTLVWGTTLGLQNLPTIRVGESTRWMVRVLSPLGKYYMSTKMGGEHYVTGWNYAGGYYLSAHFHSTDIAKDPNIQDYVFIMRLMYATILLISFTLVSFALLRRKQRIAALLYSTIPFLSPLTWEAFKIFYTESTLILCFNAILISYFYFKNMTRLYFWSAFLLSFSISTKITGVLFFLPIIYTLYRKDKLGITSLSWKGFVKIEGFVLLSLIFFGVINVTAQSPNRWVNEMVANVYHYKTGHYETITTGHWIEVFSILHIWFLLLPVSIYLIYKSSLQDKFLYYALSLCAVVMIVNLTSVGFFFPRNFTTPMVIFSFLIAIGLGELINQNLKKIALSFLFASLLSYSFIVIKNYKSINKDSFAKQSHSQCNTSTLIDIDEQGFNNPKRLKPMPNKFILSEQENEFLRYLSGNDCVFVKRIGNNKHYTNYLLLKEYDLSLRKGDIFFFKRK